MGDEDWGGSDDYWGSPQDTQQDNQQGVDGVPQPQAPQGIPGMTPMAPQPGIPGMPSSQGAQQGQQGGFPQGQNQGFPQDNFQPGQQGGFPQAQPGIPPQGGAPMGQQDKPKSDNKSFVMILIILLVIALVTVGVYSFQKGIKAKNAASITTSQQSQSNSNNGRSASPESRPSQSATSSPSEKDNNTEKEAPNTSWDSPKDDSSKSADVHGLSEVGSLPDVASRGSSGAIVVSKHVYTLDNSYVYSLELSLSTGQSNSVEFFVSKDNFNKINTGTIVSVEYVQYSDGRVGVVSISSKGNSSEN